MSILAPAGSLYDSPHAHLVERAMELALAEVGVLEEGGQNRGRRVEQYQAAIGLPPGQPYCLAFCVWAFDRAAKELGMDNPLTRSGKVSRLWRKAPEFWRCDRPTVGSIFCRALDPSDPESKGHAGLVVGVTPTHIVTVEANTSPATKAGQKADRDGGGVHRKIRPLDYVTLGYVDIRREISGEDPTVPSGRLPV